MFLVLFSLFVSIFLLIETLSRGKEYFVNHVKDI
jgi:hypothetical protein